MEDGDRLPLGIDDPVLAYAIGDIDIFLLTAIAAGSRSRKDFHNEIGDDLAEFSELRARRVGQPFVGDEGEIRLKRVAGRQVVANARPIDAAQSVLLDVNADGCTQPRFETRGPFQLMDS